jgi:hypothetical protein
VLSLWHIAAKSLSFDDDEFFQKLYAILTAHIEEPISAIGGLDIP